MCELQRILGFKKEIRGGLVFCGKSTLFYISGQTGIFHNLKRDVQRFTPVIEKNEFTAMVLNENNLLALASKGLTPKLAVYNLKSTEKFLLPNSEFNSISEYVYASFSDDNEYLAAQGGTPNWAFLRWNLGNRSLLGVHFPLHTEIGAKVLKFSFDPRNRYNVVAIGRYFFRIYHFKNENRCKEEIWHEFERSRKTFHSITWLQMTEQFAVGTSDGHILIFERKQLLQKVNLVEKLAEVPRILNKIGNPEDKCVTFILSTKARIICSYGGNSVLCLQWKINKKDFNIVASVHIPQQGECFTEGSKIVQLALNSREDILAAATDNGQILTFSFKVSGLLESIGYEADFKATLNQQHKTRIICAATALNSPVHVTCSARSLILWDYQTWQLRLLKKFDSDICSVSVHPLGLNILVGFSDNCKVYNVLNDKLEEIQEFDTERYLQVKFSEGGHMLALVNNEFTELYSNLSFQKLAKFNNEDKIKCLLWKDNDCHLLLLTKKGLIYELDVAQKIKVWSFSLTTDKFRTLAAFNSCIYAGTSDKIFVFNNYMITEEIATHVRAVSILRAEFMLLAGYENGVICGFKLQSGNNISFETYCHKGSIINMTIKENGSLLMVTGEDGAISLWKTNHQSENSTSLFNEVLIEQQMYDSNVEMISDLEKELQKKKLIAERRKDEQLQSQERERKQLEEHYEDIQNQLNQTLIDLSEENYNLQNDIEKRKLEKIASLCKERDENYADFQTKFEKEKQNIKKLTEERQTKVEKYESQVLNIEEEIKASNDRAQRIKEEKENRLKELQITLQMEFDAREKIRKQDEEFYRNIEEKAKALSEEVNFKFAADLEATRKENQFLIAEVERLLAVLNNERECSRGLDAEIEKKKRMYDGLKKTTEHIKYRISEIKKDIKRKESAIEDRIAMIKLLEEDSTETAHMNAEANWRLKEFEKNLEDKSTELAQLTTELQKLEIEQRNLTKKLKLRQRDQLLMEEKLKATERSIADSTEKILKAQMLLERYRKEFIDATKDIESPMILRAAMLKLYYKMILQKSKKEEVFTEDTDPFMKFCRQRDHYESLINTVLNRKKEIQASFRNTYTNLAKENSDWTAFAESLSRDIEQKKEKIEILEKCVKLPPKDFSKDASETQKRFIKAYESLKRLEKEEEEEIQKRIDVMEKQTTELQRLHAISVVEERGKIARKIGH